MNSQKIALFGTSNEGTRRLAAEALRKGHIVTAIVRNQNEFNLHHPNLKVVQGDVKKKEDVRKYATGQDVVICAHEPVKTQAHEHVDITRSVVEGVKESGIHNVLFVAHPATSSLETAEEFSNSFKPIIQAQHEALRLLQKEKGQLHWGYVHSIEPEKEEKTGKYRISNEILFTTRDGESRLPVKEYNATIIDLAENSEAELHDHKETQY